MTSDNPSRPAKEPWKKPFKQVLDELDVNEAEGLGKREIQNRREKYGPNRLRRAERRSVWEILLEQFRSMVVILLIVAAIVSFIFGEIIEGFAIAAVIAINALLGFITELRAVRSMEALQELGQPMVRVKREGKIQEISAEKVVLGDIVVLESGDVVSADLRLTEAAKLQANESVLTGESVPVSKQIEPLEGETPLAERNNMLFKGTAVTRGSGEGVVVAVGMQTELGQISSLVEEADQEVTPLERRLDQLGQRLVWITLAIAAVIAGVGILVGKDILLIVETAIALAVATVPEGLPIVATIALARGMWRMAQRNALISRLSAVETLGATNVICTDKTGTLTENQMTLTEILISDGEIEVTGEGMQVEGEFIQDENRLEPQENKALWNLLKMGVLCNNASLVLNDAKEQNEAIGEPLEIALLVAGYKAGLKREPLLDDMPEEREVAFDPESKMMATFHRENDHLRVAVKGAPEAILQRCASILTDHNQRDFSDEDRQEWSNRNEQLAEDGLRVLGIATKTTSSSEDYPYEDLIFLGLVGLIDPPREEVRPALEDCKSAGIRVIMVTGDHPITARKIALAVNLVEGDSAEVLRGQEIKPPEKLSSQEREKILEARILARVNPEQKLDLISIHQNSNAIVAMTGDGVNDAPALKKADIGIAMGQRGTQVAKEAADMVLRDDAFSTIVVAVQQGRIIFDNIRKFVFYLLSCNISEIMVVSIASFVNAPLPIRPLQILFLNLVTDVFPALALGVGEGDAAIMNQAPRDPKEPILTRKHWIGIGGYGSMITLSVLGIFALALDNLGMELQRAVTISFLTLAAAQLWHVFNMRDQVSGIIRNEVTRNLYVWGALVLTIGLLFAAIYLPWLSNLLQTVDPGLDGWMMVLVASLIPLIIGQIAKVLANYFGWQLPL